MASSCSIESEKGIIVRTKSDAMVVKGGDGAVGAQRGPYKQRVKEEIANCD